MADLQAFREETKSWLAENCPKGARGPGEVHTGSTKVTVSADTQAWMEMMAEKGWTVPMWEKEYGGAGLSIAQTQVLFEEMSAIDARPPLVNMGTRMLGPTLLEFGTEDQKKRHLNLIARGGAAWCQGYSEPGSGSDLASLQTKAVMEGDHFVINGQKIWTSGADHADWMFALVRTDPNASKHDGISFVLLDMHQAGVTVKPIPLISGSSPFCETFFDNAIALRSNLIGELNKGWTVGKRLLQYERSAAPAPRRKKTVKTLNPYAQIGVEYLGQTGDRISDLEAREKITKQVMLEKSMQLTVQRVMAEAKSGRAPGATTSIFKLVGSTIAKEASALKSELRGLAGVGWEGEGFNQDELEATRGWLRDRAVTIYGGTNEVQMNIIAKRVLGLPD
jgi:alkylation response protein AidB-like acyl-CoA dehydrogenase